MPPRSSRPPADGFIRMGMDVPLETHVKFKMICPLRRTTMSFEVAAITAAQVEQGDSLLTESLYVATTPELKRELTAYAKAHQMRLEDVITEAFQALREKRGEPELPETVTRQQRVQHRRPGERVIGTRVIS